MDMTKSVAFRNLPNGRYGGTKHQLLSFNGDVLKEVVTLPFDVTGDTASTPVIEVTPA